MRSISQWAALGLLVLDLPVVGRAEAYPQVRIEARVNGPIFGDVTEPELTKLKDEIQVQVRDAAEKRFPCMGWVTGERAAKADVRARLVVELSERRNPWYSWFDLTFSGAVGDHQPVALWTALSVFATLDSSWSPRSLQGLKDHVYPRIEDQFEKQELRRIFDADFIASIPITESIQVDARVREVIVPVNAKRVNLEPETLLKVTLRASLCPLKPEECSRMGLMSKGAGDGDLRCRIESLDCCTPDWPPGFADRLERAKNNVKVFLSENHRHCLQGPGNCPGPDPLFLFRHRGTSR
jgi:hypothetical protein